MAVMNSLSGQLAIDGQALSALKLEANRSPGKALQGAAKQFEAEFLNMILKSMRATLPKEGLLDSEATDLYTGMLDQQFAQKLSDRGVGLADLIAKQLGHAKDHSAAAAAVEASVATPANVPIPAAPSEDPACKSEGKFGSAHAFAEGLWDEANEAARKTGIPAKFLIGQAALESGWGRREIRAQDGTPSFNLFGIKADRSWDGPSVKVQTTEYVAGIARKEMQTFRAYSSYAESFADYARLLTTNPRYADSLQHSDDSLRFAQSLQKAGYATDPRYAEKLAQVINHRVLQQLIG